jgi:hypothetical protein
VRKAEAKIHLGGLRKIKMLRAAMGVNGKALFHATSINGCTKQMATKEALVAVGLREVSSAAVCCSVELCFQGLSSWGFDPEECSASPELCPESWCCQD